MSLSKSPHRIVAIEDNPGDTNLLRMALDEQHEPYVLEVLPDGESALDFISHHCSRPEPCLIILDLNLPRYDGVTILRAIRSQPELAHIKVVVMTSSASPRQKEEVLALGVESWRMKPGNWDQMVELARELIAICSNPPAPTFKAAA